MSAAMEQNNLKVKIKAQWRRELAEKESRLCERPPIQMQHVMDCSSEGSIELACCTALEELGFSLHKGAFCDALCSRFGWQPPHIPFNCVCNKPQTVEHALSCSHQGFPSLMHNDIRNIIAKCLSEVCQKCGSGTRAAAANWGVTAAEDSIFRKKCMA